MRVSLQQATDLLNRGYVVAVPTETVYGLAASLHHPAAVEAIFTLKGRPSNNPLIIHIANVDQLIPFVQELPPNFPKLIEHFWPGPMTLVLPIDEKAVSTTIRAGLPNAAFRMPEHHLARALLAQTGPLVMPSANLSGKPSATSPEHVEADFGEDFPVLDGGNCTCGLESTILIYSEDMWRVIRLGAIPPEAFKEVLGYTPRVVKHDAAAPLCPGQMYRHYAPKAELKLTTKFTEEMSGVVLGYTDRQYPAGLSFREFGSLNSPENVAENLYRSLRQLDADNIPIAWVDVNVPSDGLWGTILERLNKASDQSF